MEFDWIDEIQAKDYCLHLDDRSLMKRSLELQICEFIDLLQEFDLNLLLWLLRIGLLNGFDS
jgi:hypothetical protein